ncbi:MAG: Gfo/Idh/MocA family oxidoreductase [Acidimicrobiia bacterium]|nr:Gfo/Idh/MocA family oxidoreductase [Acidimicrobiia bacterium]MDH4305878.1 Gfo/Idh/MocA family oxidoreductase [Acidimicrobiia bacterium]MDH5295247.1 Gfo/Idh/MocA family oxidoreductase [Acidimicrobiia bacterium]
MTRSTPIRLAVVGAGKIGTHRALLAGRHPGVERLVIVDLDPDKAQLLAERSGADGWSSDLESVAGDVDAVIVSTQEGEHVAPVTAALRAGAKVLVEKPLALDLAGADEILEAGDPRVGYSMRYAQRYAVAKSEIEAGKLGRLVGGLARVYDTIAIGRTILARSPGAGPVLDILTYVVDVLLWYHPSHPVEVYAKGHGTLLRSEGYEADDLVFAILTFADGSVFDLVVSYSLPANYPIAGLATRFELLGDEGFLIVSEDHGDQVLVSDHGYDNVYATDHHLDLAYLGSRTSGEWALGNMFGRVADETRAWIEHLTTGAPCHITTGAEARTVLAVTLAIEESVRTGERVKLGEGASRG